MKRFIFILAFAFSISACGPQRPDTAPDVDPAVNALTLQNAGNYLAAAEEYQVLAEQYPDKAYLYQLNAADNFLRGNSTVNAKNLLDTIQIPETEKIASLKLAVLYGKYYSINQQPQEALNVLDILPPLDAPRHLLRQYHQLRADGFILLDNRLAGVNELMLVDSYTDSSIEKETLQAKLWDTLITFSSNDLKSQTLSGQSASVAWFKLAAIFTESQFESGILRSRVNGWQEEYPNHPANNQIIPEFLQKSLLYATEAKNIALLLPFAGPYKNASSAIREGFVAAWYENKNDSNIKVYDANSLNIGTVYQQAINDGADIVVGPLEKQAIKTLLNQGALSVKTIVLNHIDESGIEENLLFQFGLSPEDEARQVARRAFAEGHKTAIVIRPNNAWGERVYDAFAEELSNLGGEILDHTAFDINSRELSAPVKLILDIDASDARGKLLRSRLNRKIYTEPRSRKDADFIFTAGTGNMGSLLLPQLWFFQATPLPMYATSHIYSGTRDKQANIDLNGLKIVDMPWVVEPQHESSIIQEQLNQNWNQQSSSLRRLYAFGIDTYRLINELGKMNASSSYNVKGETGYLRMDEQKRIYRNLSWASIQDGEPVLDKPASF